MIIFVKLLLIITLLYSNEPDFIYEELHYNAGFRFLPAGQANLYFTKDTLNGNLVYKLNTSINTNSFIDRFYQVRDNIQSWLKISNFSLLKTIQNINQGNYHLNHQSIIKGDSLILTNTDVRKISTPVYDPISFIYFLRTKTLNIGDTYNFFSYSPKKIRKVLINISSIENIEVPAGNFNCFKIEPLSNDGKPLMKNNGQMRVWISNDSLKLPVQIEQITNIGTMVMKLKKIKHN